MSTLKDVLKSINHNKYSSASVLALTSLLVFRSTLAYLDYKGYGIESSTFNEAFENLAILGSFLVASVSTASTFYATKYSKERFHEIWEFLLICYIITIMGWVIVQEQVLK